MLFALFMELHILEIIHPLIFDNFFSRNFYFKKVSTTIDSLKPSSGITDLEYRGSV